MQRFAPTLVCLSMLANGAGCATGPRASWPPPISAGGLELPADRLQAVSGFKAELEAAFAAKDVERVMASFAAFEDSVRKWTVEVLPAALAPFEVQLEPVFAIGAGVVCKLMLFMPRHKRGGYARYNWGDLVYLGPAPDGRWRFFEYPPDEVYKPRLLGVRALVWLHPAAEWLRAEVELEIEPNGEALLAFDFPVRLPGQRGGFRLVEASQQGRACAHRLIGDRLIVRPNTLAERIQLRLRFEGEPPQSPHDYLTADEVHLRASGRWLPTLPTTQADFELTLRYPQGYTLFGQGSLIASGPAPDEPGWREDRWRIAGEDGQSVWGAKAYTTRTVTVKGLRLTVALWPRHAANLDKVTDTAVGVLEKLMAFLGPYPHPELRVVETGNNDGRSGYGAITNVGLGWRNLEAELEPAFFAHEFSHGWWGGQVPLAPQALSRGQWNETVAEYSSAQALDAAQTAALRRKWSQGYASLPDKSDQPMLQVGTRSANWGVHQAISYHKGALLMTALEDRIGRETLQKVLAGFLAARRGQPSTWSDFVEVLGRTAGQPQAEWLLGWLQADGAPALALAEILTEGGQIVGRVTCQPGLGLTGTVELGVLAKGRRLATHRQAFDERGASFSFELPAGADELVLDPDHRIPRRYDPRADPLKAGLRASLVPAAPDAK